MSPFERAVVREKALHLAIEWHEKKDEEKKGIMKSDDYDIIRTADKFFDFMLK